MLQSEGIFRQAGALGDLLILEPLASVEMAGGTASVLSNDLIIDVGQGSLTPTPTQAEGPYYPMARVADFDNDLTIAP